MTAAKMDTRAGAFPSTTALTVVFRSHGVPSHPPSKPDVLKRALSAQIL